MTERAYKTVNIGGNERAIAIGADGHPTTVPIGAVDASLATLTVQEPSPIVAEHALNELVEDFEDQDWTDNFSVIDGNWSIVTDSFEGSYAVEHDSRPDSAPGHLGSDLTFDTYGLKFRFRVKVQDTAKDNEDGSVRFGYTDLSNQYGLGIRPSGTDNPGLELEKTVGGSTTSIFNVAPQFSRETYLVVRAEMTVDGTFAVEIDHSTGTQRVSAVIDDISELTSGQFVLHAFTNATYDLIEVNRAQGGGELPDVA